MSPSSLALPSPPLGRTPCSTSLHWGNSDSCEDEPQVAEGITEQPREVPGTTDMVDEVATDNVEVKGEDGAVDAAHEARTPLDVGAEGNEGHQKSRNS